MLALASAVWVVIGAGILFLLLMLLWWTVGLLKETKVLLRRARSAGGEVSQALRSVAEETRTASERAERISRSRRER